ncbi:ABC transporter substrate-binding protein [Prochlorothrix hollandica]|uniref:ABC transporter substrate-binding protein n=1 Tax=Prochlorothrix hollandica TaxID=1223 RepID=UPI000347DE3C|nr:ABC transporter substrate-binding protein [Prochlorothrix hollandica]
MIKFSPRSSSTPYVRLPPFSQGWASGALGLAIALGLVSGCGGEPGAEVNRGQEEAGLMQTGDRIILGTTLRPRTLDPADAYEVSSLNLIYNLGDRLYTYDFNADGLNSDGLDTNALNSDSKSSPNPGGNSGDLVPQLATELPQISDDGLTYTIPLRSGVTFHDGTAFDAAAMAFSLERFMTQGGKPAFLLRDIVDRVEATGDLELTIHLQQPFAAFTALLAFPGLSALSPTAYGESGGAAGGFQPEQWVGTGPYRLRDMEENTIHLEVFADYWGEPPANGGVDIQIYKDNPANLFNSFRTGQVDVAYLNFDPQQIETLMADAAAGRGQAVVTQGVAVTLMVLNQQQPPLDQLPVRRAIAAAVDRPLLLDRALQGQGELLYSLVPPQVPGSVPVFQPQESADRSTMLAQAQADLRAAGYGPENPAAVELWYPNGSPIRGQAAAVLQSSIPQALGGLVDLTVQGVDSATGFSNIGKGLYPSFLISWYPDFLDGDNYLHPFLSCEAGSAAQGCTQGGAQSQGSFYWSEAVNRLIAQERQAQDPQERLEILAQIQAIAAADVPYIPLWQDRDYAFSQTGVTGVTITPSQNFPLWTIAKPGIPKSDP